MAAKNTKRTKQNLPQHRASTLTPHEDKMQSLVRELRNLAAFWRNSPSDPHGIANAVMVSLLEVSNAIVRAYGKPPDNRTERQPPG